MPHVTKATTAEDQKFQAEEDVRTLSRAAEIRKDKPRHARAAKEARAQMAALNDVGGNKDG